MKILILSLIAPILAFARYPIEYPMTVTKVDRAAIRVLDSINPTSIKRNIEYGGAIYINESYAVEASPPITDSNPHSVVILPDTGLLTRKFIKVANYHTHAAQNPDYMDETFSHIDTNGTRFKEYLATPMGKIIKYDPRFGKMLILNRNKDLWEIYNFIDPDDYIVPINPKLRLYDKIPPSILEN